MVEPLIKTEDLWHIYPGNMVALRGVNLEIYPRETTAIVGSNGCGKTTLLKHFNGLLLPTKGRVLVKGMDTRETEVSELALYLGLIFQDPRTQLFEKTCFEEVSFGPKCRGLPKEEVREKVEAALEVVGLLDERDSHPYRLTIGSQQKVALASVLVNEPGILLLDEPMTGLSQLEALEYMETLRKVSDEKGFTILFVTHNMRLVSRFAKSTIVMEGGRVLMNGPTQEVFSKPEELAKASLKPPQLTELANRLSKRYSFVSSGILSVEEMSKVLLEALL